MGLESFKIIFDSPTNSYYAGQAVTGRVLISLSKSKKVRALKISFKGSAETKFLHEKEERGTDGNTRKVTENITDDETFFEYNYNLLGGSSEVEIPIGENVFPFSATLPVQMPSSFEGEHGFIRYKVKATLDQPWKFDQHAEATFAVVTPLDLNFYEQAKVPVKKEECKHFCCLCCQSGPLTMVVCLPYTGFVSGGTLPFTIEVDNASNVDVTGVRVEILKNVTYRVRGASGGNNSNNSNVVKLELEGVPANNSKTWTQNLSIPQMPYHNLTTCSIIIMKYVLKAVTVVSGAHLNLELEIPLTMGSTPIIAAAPINPNAENVTPQVPLIGFNSNPNAPSAPPSHIYPTLGPFVDFNKKFE